MEKIVWIYREYIDKRIEKEILADLLATPI